MQEILFTTIVVGSISVVSFSFANIRNFSNRLCNGERKQLDRFDKTARRFEIATKIEVKEKV